MAFLFSTSQPVDGAAKLQGSVRLTETENLASEIAQYPDCDLSNVNLLILSQKHAGIDALQRIKGQFSFVSSLPSGEILAARDQLGIEPLYYSLQRGQLQISNDLNQLASGAPNLTLNRSWLAGFVAYGYGSSHDETVYNEIKRLPPAHYLLWSNGKLGIHRYWSLPFNEPPRYGSEEEICEAFRSVLDKSLRDHLPEGPCGLMLSGGLDSSTLAAEIVRIRGSARDLRPHTRVIDSLIKDDERMYVDLIGQRLGFTPRYVNADGLFYDPEWKSHRKQTAEPNMLVLNARLEDPIAAAMAVESPVWFEGEGPDNALVFEWHAYLRWLARSGQWRQFLSDTLLYMARKPAIEWVNHIKGLAYRLRRPEKRAGAALLSWANPTFRGTLEYALTGEEQHKQRHPWHPRAFSSFQSPIWQNFLESYSPTVTGTPIEWRHPYLDLRVLEFMLSLPPVPWGRQKYLMRKAMAGRLPREVLRRRKTPLQGDPWKTLLQSHPLGPLSRGSIEEFFDLSKLPLAPSHSAEVDRLLRIHILDSWLRSRP